MDSTISPEALATRKRLGSLQVLSGFLFFISLSLSDLLTIFFPGHQEQWGIKLGILVLHWSPVVMFMVVSHRLQQSHGLQQSDELQLLIRRQASVFAFYGLFIVIFLIKELQSAALIPTFEWTAHRLIVAMFVLWLTGFAWSKRRYR